MRSVVACGMLLIPAPAAAQTAPKVVKTLRVESTRQPLFTVETDGTVRIDWRRVETVARSADLTDRDAARALMAVRDGTAQPAH